MKWEKVKLGDCCEITSSKRIFFSEYTESGVPFYRSKEIIECSNGQAISEPLFISQEKYNEIKRKFGVPQSGDMLLTSVGTIGVPYIVTKEDYFYFKDGNLTWFRNFNDALSSQYLFYWVRSAEGQGVLHNTTIGSSQKALTIASLKGLEFPCPPLAVQCRIAEILSAYDDLIENNQRQIKLLEEAAQRLYKEWFVDFRFPGHETTPITNGIPEGWKKKTVAECLAFHGNGGWGKEIATGKNIYLGKVIRGTDIQDIKSGLFAKIPERYHSENDIKSRTLKKDDIIFELSNGNINNIGRCLLIDNFILKKCGINTICASFCKLLRPLDAIHSLLLYCEIQDMQTSGRMTPLKKNGANGINNFDFEGFLNHALLVSYDENIIAPIKLIVNKISTMQSEITLLSEARDRLLPKLMSGEIEVVG